MGSAFHQLCLRYSGTLTPTAPTAIRLWETFTFLVIIETGKNPLIAEEIWQVIISISTSGGSSH